MRTLASVPEWLAGAGAAVAFTTGTVIGLWLSSRWRIVRAKQRDE